MISEKQKHLKIIDKYKFCFHKYLAKNIQRWKWTVETCTAYLKINENYDILLNVSDTDHNHDALWSSYKSTNSITNENETFLFLNDSINGIVMFTCKSNLEFLIKIKTVYVNGTFELTLLLLFIFVSGLKTLN
jgi:hypothetical protein